MSGPSQIGRISGTTGIDSGLKRQATADNLKAAGQQFEAVFTGMMLKSMRAAKLAEPLFDSQAIDTFRDMQDQKMVQQMAKHTPLGIGEAMTEFLSRGLSATAAENQNDGEKVVEPPADLQPRLNHD
ncbi:rod-binding protein [Sphingomonas sp.]|uniref:rod-binding protein n=1 Tax=Sphingomonas sp. TaxID=28214 RepID=UPI00261FD445|nr:rod-binding protein [Sphingomonas sp.]MDF2494397.1 rod-binding protein [Sphingomonas sp.]